MAGVQAKREPPDVSFVERFAFFGLGFLLFLLARQHHGQTRRARAKRRAPEQDRVVIASLRQAGSIRHGRYRNLHGNRLSLVTIVLELHIHTIFLLKTRQMCYTVSGDENEEIRDNH